MVYQPGKTNLNPRKNKRAPLENQNHNTVFTIPENLPLSNAENLFLAKASSSFPYPRKATNSLPDTMSKNFFAAFMQLKAFFHNKEDKSDNTEILDAFETLKSKWTTPEGQLALIDYFIKNAAMMFIN